MEKYVNLFATVTDKFYNNKKKNTKNSTTITN